MADAKLAHEKLEKFTSISFPEETVAGIALSYEVVRRMIDNSLASMGAQTVDIESSQTFKVNGKKLKLKFSVSLDATGIDTFFDPTPSYDGGPLIPSLVVKDVIANIVVLVAFNDSAVGIPPLEVAEIKINYSEIRSAIQLQDREIVLNLLRNSNIPSVDVLWERLPEVLEKLETDFGFEEESIADLKNQVYAIRFMMPDELADQFVNSLTMPNLFDLFPGILFTGEGKIGVEREFFLLSSHAELNFESCAVSTTSNTVQPETRPDNTGIFIPQGSPSRRYPLVEDGQNDHDDWGQEFSSEGQVFLYAPNELFNVNFKGIAKPSVGMSERGRKGIIRWGYTGSLLLKQFSLTQVNPLHYHIDAPLHAVGMASASVKIGCVTTRVAGLAFQGDIKPLTISFRFYFDFPRKEIVLISRIVKVDAPFFEFMTSVPWPLSTIAEWLLSRVTKKAVKGQAGKILTKTRIPIADWLPLEEYADVEIGNAVAYHEDHATDSIVIGAPLNL